MKKIRLAIVIILTLLLIVSVGIIVRTKLVNVDDTNEISYSETYYFYEETELSNETEEISSESYSPTEIK